MTTGQAGGTRVLSGRYELHEKLGVGGMAEVFLGRDRVLGRTVAVKVLLAQFAGDPQFIARFRREAQSAAALNHPNIVGVYDTGSDDGIHYIVMEFIEGKTLRELVREEGPLLPERAAEIAADVCGALAFAHAHGIVHRDVKPANIMLTAGGGVKVTDFGIARAISGETVTQTAAVLGTAQYFSPEQAQAGPVDARSDLYSLGVVVYEMLTRQVPFTGSSPVAIAYKHVKEDPIPPVRLNADVPRGIQAIVMKTLAKNPANRYQSAQEMREDLLRAAQGRPVSATPVLDDHTAVVGPLGDETVVITRRPGGTPAATAEAARRRRRTGFVAIAVFAVAALGFGIWVVMRALSGPELLSVPDVVGRDVSEAQRTLRAAGFQVEVLDPVYSEELGVGVVVDQIPPGLTSLAEGGTVQIVPSAGPQLISVPDVVGRPVADARRIIEEANLSVGSVTEQASTQVAPWRVIDQNPAKDALLRAGGPVSLVVSSGPPTAIVPNVVGLDEGRARNELARRGLETQVVREGADDCPVEVGMVCRQDPPAEAVVEDGSTVTIFVRREEPPVPTPAPPEGD